MTQTERSPAFEAKFALSALKGDRTMRELPTQYDLQPNQTKQWKDQLLDGVSDVFDDKPRASKAPLDKAIKQALECAPVSSLL
jgi:transposase